MGGVPISCSQYRPALAAEVLDIGVDGSNEAVCAGDGQCATGEEIILQIDQEKSGMLIGLWNDRGSGTCRM